jgi:hypothetical protein
MHTSIDLQYVLNCCFFTSRRRMLPVVAASALASGSLLLHKRRQQHLRAKPQRRFKLHLTDNTDKPFQHFICSATALECTGNDAAAAAAASEQQHPYAAEIQQLLANPRCPRFFTPEQQLTASTPAADAQPAAAAAGASLAPHASAVQAALPGLPSMPPALANAPLVWIDTPKKLRSMLQQLQGVACIGLDTEHTAHRSYLGVTCLLQLSTGAAHAAFTI